MKGFALVDQGFMVGAFSHVELSRKAKWFVIMRFST